MGAWLQERVGNLNRKNGPRIYSLSQFITRISSTAVRYFLYARSAILLAIIYVYERDAAVCIFFPVCAFTDVALFASLRTGCVLSKVHTNSNRADANLLCKRFVDCC